MGSEKWRLINWTFGTFGDGNFDWWWKHLVRPEKKRRGARNLLVEKIIDATRGINENEKS